MKLKNVPLAPFALHGRSNVVGSQYSCCNGEKKELSNFILYDIMKKIVKQKKDSITAF